ncbi:tungsten formylmethanofuran dehydrogenase subunit E [Reticulibacter mediterranei]|uniref:3-methyl-2-oxobutanoate dehydrogenase (2-methylpropanoyl-transferring) n=1 Tax=Reticulibacter mediterranei TaxID=2778369 RepID=A0A8J3ITU5_9CHLR|nr:alpha-ketoacid dehydrogenase subunit alpha/beta [Reticulibacter mediterranei]GHO96780.1 tungsten formylmethanofuran dehydrogenase subunit E [Reticulibacter mediterranei]
MTVNIRATEAATLAQPLDVIALYRTMVTARVMNDLLKIRKTQGHFPFYIGCAGHESMAAVAAALGEDDWLALYYRDLAAWLQRTGDRYGPLREAYSRVTGPMAAGRNMPSHYSSPQYHILPGFSEVAGLVPFAGGVGFALKQQQSKALILCSTGDGGAATNDFHVLLRMSAVHQLPVLMVIEDNGWAITTPSTTQWAGSLVDWAKGGGIYAEEVDGTDAIATYEATCRFVQHIRSGQGPVLMHLRQGLLDPHSSSTDIKTYRKKEEIQLTAATKDPVKNFGLWLVERGYLQEADIDRTRKEIRAELERIEREVLQEPGPTGDRVLDHVVYVPEWRENHPRGAKRQLTMLGAINEALVELAQRDPDFFVYGQDVGSPKGGVFGATSMLVSQFPERAISSPLNEQLIIGLVAGSGMHDGKARCAEIQFVDYHQSAAQTIRLAARISYQTYGIWKVPMVIRAKSGSGGGGPISSSGSAGGGAFGHSNAGEQWFTSIPGMITICPATPFDAKGLLLEAARAQSPVTFLERGRLYRSEPPKDNTGRIVAEMAEYWQVPDGYYTLPIGKARRIHIGQGKADVAIIAWGTMVLEACSAATNMAKKDGGAIEVVDLRTLAPFDEETVAAAVKEANRVIVVTEEADLNSFGRHIHSWIVEHCFYDLDGVPAFISAVRAPAAPYNAPEETAFYPGASAIEEKIEQLRID